MVQRKVLAVSTVLAGLAAASPPGNAQSTDADETVENRKFRPVSLTCPADNAGRFELISKNAKGETQKLYVHYRAVDGQSERAVGIDVYKIRKPGGYAELETTIDLLKLSGGADEVTAGKVMRIADAIMEKVCLTDARRQHFLQWLEDNQAQMPH